MTRSQVLGRKRCYRSTPHPEPVQRFPLAILQVPRKARKFGFIRICGCLNLQYLYPEFPRIERHSRVGHALVYQWGDPGSGLSDAQVCGELEMHV